MEGDIMEFKVYGIFNFPGTNSWLALNESALHIKYGEYPPFSREEFEPT
jgi:hypothetical protein